MFSLRRGNLLPAGLDIGHDGVKLIQLEVRGGGFCVTAVASRPLPDPCRADARARLKAGAELGRQMLAEAGFSGRRVVASLPAEGTHWRTVRVTPGAPDRMESAAIADAQTTLPFDLARARRHYLSAGPIRQGDETRHEAIVAACSDEDVRNLLRELDGCGMDVAALDLSPVAAYRAVARLTGERGACAVADVGASHTDIVIGTGNQVRFVKTLGVGVSHFQQAVSQRLGISAEEARHLCRRVAVPRPDSDNDPVRRAVFDAARGVLTGLADEVARCLRYYMVTFRGEGPKQLSLLGGGAGDSQLQAVFSAATGIPATAAGLYSRVRPPAPRPGDRDEWNDQWGVAVGLCLKSAPPGVAPRALTAAEEVVHV